MKRNPNLDGATESDEIQSNWVPLARFMLDRASKARRLPLRKTHNLDIETGRFIKRGCKSPQGLGPGRFSLLIAIYDLHGREDCGDFPARSGKEICDFWSNECRLLQESLAAGTVKLWGRRGGTASPFVLIGRDTWKKAYEGSLDYETGPMNFEEWLAITLAQDRLIGCDEKVVSLYAEDIAPTMPTGRRGRIPSAEWPKTQKKAIALMDSRGDFDTAKKDWNCRARLEAILLENPKINVTQLREHLKVWLPEWRSKKADGK